MTERHGHAQHAEHRQPRLSVGPLEAHRLVDAEELVREGRPVRRQVAVRHAGAVQELGGELVLVHAPEVRHVPLQRVEAGAELGVALRHRAAGREEHEDVVADHLVLALVVHPLDDHAPPLRALPAAPLHAPLRVLHQVALHDVARRPLHQRGDGQERHPAGRWDGAPGEDQRRLDAAVP